MLLWKLQVELFLPCWGPLGPGAPPPRPWALIRVRAAAGHASRGRGRWRLLVGKGLVSCVRRRQLPTQLCRVPEAGTGDRSPGFPGTGAASCTTSRRPTGPEWVPSVSCWLGQPGPPRPTSRTPNLRAKVRMGVCGTPALIPPAGQGWGLDSQSGSVPNFDPPRWVLGGQAGI